MPRDVPTLPEEVIVAPQNAISVPQGHQGVDHGSVHTRSVEKESRCGFIHARAKKLVEEIQQKVAGESKNQNGKLG